jgi:LmeA-like phospholipid-binding
LPAAVVLALALAQVFLPRIVASRISSRVGRYGKVQSVSVKAWPAVELLWGSADSVTVRAIDLKITPAQTAKLLWEARGVSSLDLSVPSMREGALRLSDASLRKRGPVLTAQGQMSQADVDAALPAGLHLQLLSSEGGEVTVRATARGSIGGLIGRGASLDVVAGASEGELVASPHALSAGGLRLTLFSDPHVYVEALGARALAGPGRVPSYRLAITARLR